MSALRIVDADLDDGRVVALFGLHARRARASTAPGSAHALDVSGLRAAGIRVWAAWLDDDLAGVAALKDIGGAKGEVKSMHVAEAMRRRGVGQALLAHLVGEARAAGMARLYLETGAWAYFAPAHAFYEAFGFSPCAAFEGYAADRNSLYSTLEVK